MAVAVSKGVFPWHCTVSKDFSVMSFTSRWGRSRKTEAIYIPEFPQLYSIRTKGVSLKMRPGLPDVRWRIEEDPEKKSPEEEREGERAG